MQVIRNFTTNLIAFWRPKKHTYHALTWDAVRLHWKPWYGAVEGGLSKHKSTVHPDRGTVYIKLGDNNTMIRIACAGEFLMLGTTRIAIVKRLSGPTIPNGWKSHELGPLTERAGVDETISLWTTPPAPTAPPVPPLFIPIPAPVLMQPAVIATSIDPIPKRIAWLIAEDASKNDEKCPITMEPISPITASVTTCFHCFDSEAIAAWLTNHTTCPQCRKKCEATMAYTGT